MSGIVAGLPLAKLAFEVFKSYQQNTPGDQIPDVKDIEAILKSLVDFNSLTSDDFAAEALPATLLKIEGLIRAMRERFKLPAGVKIVGDLISAFGSHASGTGGLAPRPRLVATPEGAFDPQLMRVAKNQFWFWADESGLPLVVDDRPGQDGKVSKVAARGALWDAWKSWMDPLGISAKDLYFSFEEADLPDLIDAGRSVAEIDAARDAEKRKADLVVRTVTSLPDNFLAYTTVGPGGSAARGLEMQINGNKSNWSCSELQGVIAHEIGHLLGLDDDRIHKDVLMSGTKYPNVTPIGPSQGDIVAARKAGWIV